MNEVLRDEVKKIVRNELGVFRVLVGLHPEVKTDEACEMLNCSRPWLTKNKHLFNGRIINRRGDLRFSTTKIIQYKRALIDNQNIDL